MQGFCKPRNSVRVTDWDQICYNPFLVEKLWNIEIPTKNLLGYRGKKRIMRYYAPGLPNTVTGETIIPFWKLEMRPLIQVLADKKSNSSK